MSDQRPAEPRPSFGRRLGRGILWLIRFVLRLLFVLILGVALGIGLYYGAIYVFYQYVQPVQVHSIQIDQLAARQERSGLRITQRLDDLQARLEALEVQRDADKEAVAVLEAQLAVTDKIQATQTASLATLDTLQGELETTQGALQTVREAQDTLQATLEGLRAAQDDAQADLETLQAARDEVQSAIQGAQAAGEAIWVALQSLEAQVDAWTEAAAENSEQMSALAAELQGERSPAALLRELQLVKAMELLTRSRLMLVQNNLGLAQSDIESGRDLLVDLGSAVPAYQAQVLADIIARLDAAVENLPGAPVAAADELDGAWQLLVEGLPTEAMATLTPEVALTVTLTPTVALEATLVASPTLTVTAEVTATVTPTATATTQP